MTAVRRPALLLLAAGTTASCTDDGLACDSGACLGRLSINEFKPHPESDKAGFEWVELYNPGSEGVRLDGWWIEWHKADPSAPSGAAFLADDLVVPPQDVVLLGGEHVDGTDGEVDLAMGEGASGDALYLFDSACVFQDGVVYGTSNEDGMPDEPGGSPSTSLAEPPGEEETLARCPDGADTDVSGDDFHVLVTRQSPGALNGDCDPEVEPFCDLADTVEVVINEFVANPEGWDYESEWFELYNAGGTVADLDYWSFEIFKWSGDERAEWRDLPGNASVDAGGFYVVGGNAADVDADWRVTFDLGNGYDGDAIHLVDCRDNVEDIVVYGDGNEDGMTDEAGAVSTTVAPDPGPGVAVGRYPDGRDTDRSGDDFCTLAVPSPGSDNGVCVEAMPGPDSYPERNR